MASRRKESHRLQLRASLQGEDSGLKIPALQGCEIAWFTVMKVLLSDVLQQSAFNGVTIAEVKHFIWNQVYIILLFGDVACNAVQIL